MQAMTTDSLDKINDNLAALRKDVDRIKEILSESEMELQDDVKAAIDESRKRDISEFKAHSELEKKFS
jgi:hypothetical protein